MDGEKAYLTMYKYFKGNSFSACKRRKSAVIFGTNTIYCVSYITYEYL